MISWRTPALGEWFPLAGSLLTVQSAEAEGTPVVAACRVVPGGLGDPPGLEVSDSDRSLALAGKPGHHEPASVLVGGNDPEQGAC